MDVTPPDIIIPVTTPHPDYRQFAGSIGKRRRVTDRTAVADTKEGKCMKCYGHSQH